MKAVSYLRVSSKGQIDGDGFPRQRSVIDSYATTTGIEVTTEFVEEGISGTTDTVSRPALTRLFEFLQENPDVRMVIVEKADRLARDLIVSELLLQQFEKVQVEVVEAEDGNRLTGGTTPTSKLIRQVLAAVAEFEKSGLVHKLRAARDRKKAETGRCDGRKPFGHYPGEQEVLETMLRLRQAGQKLERITSSLNAAGAITRSGKPWSIGSVAKILKRHELETFLV